MASKPLRILVVAGHPADMFDHCGGTLLHHIEKGDQVTCVSITQGLRVHDEVIYDIFRHHVNEYTPEQIDEICQERQKVKYKEAVDACALFNIKDVRFLDYDDEVLCVTPEMISKLAMLMREVQPDLIITHWPYQGVPFSNHHAVTGQLTMAAITAAHGVNFKDRNPSCHVAQVAYMLCPRDTAASDLLGHGRTAFATHYVDVTDVVDKKVKAVAMMRSQKYNTINYAYKTAEQWNGNLGVRIRTGYAEAFAMLYPEIHDTIPVSDHRMWLAHGDEKELLEKGSNMDALKVELD